LQLKAGLRLASQLRVTLTGFVQSQKMVSEAVNDEEAGLHYNRFLYDNENLQNHAAYRDKRVLKTFLIYIAPC
jgi:hypothetical protein